MGAFLGISLWVALATVVPGLITLACLFAGVEIVNPELMDRYMSGVLIGNDWIWTGFAVTVMVITQAFGILLEDLMIRKEWLGPATQDIDIPEGIDPRGETQYQLQPYKEYDGLYILLAELGKDEDSQGHLKRALAQFFLTNNSLVSFSAGIIFTVVICAFEPSLSVVMRGAAYIGVMGLFLFLSYRVVVIRFDVMVKTLWATRRKRVKEIAKSEEG